MYNEDEPLFRDTLRTSALVFAAEADLFCAMQERFEFDLAGSDGRQHQASNGSLRLSRAALHLTIYHEEEGLEQRLRRLKGTLLCLIVVTVRALFV